MAYLPVLKRSSKQKPSRKPKKSKTRYVVIYQDETGYSRIVANVATREEAKKVQEDYGDGDYYHIYKVGKRKKRKK